MMDFQGCLRSAVLGCACMWSAGGGIGLAQAGPAGCPAAMAAQGTPCAQLARQIEALLGAPEVVRAHWGVKVMGLDGSSIYAMNEGQLFQPASNAKLFTTATAMALLGGGRTFETKVVGKGVFSGTDQLVGDVVLVGDGDANLSGRTVPYVSPKDRPKREKGAPPLPEVDALRYLAAMADQVAATGLKAVNGDVVGDDTLFPWEPYPEEWTIDDSVWGYGAPVSALTINDNQLSVTVTPGAVAGSPAAVTVNPAVAYYTVDVSGLLTGTAKSGSHVQMERALGSKVLRVYGTIAVDSAADEEEVAIHDPVEYAAVVLKGMLEARGIVVSGVARAKHRLPTETKGFVAETHEAMPDLRVATPDLYPLGRYGRGKSLAVSSCDHCDTKTLPMEKLMASHRSSELWEDVVVTNKVSQNLHAELLLHQLGLTVAGEGSTAQGARVVRAFLTTKVGVDGEDFIFFDGSGLSGHDLVTPRATAQLLQYAMGQPWFADWKKSLPVGGEDGSLASRFPKAPLAEHVFAKTGTLGEARALSGYVDCASGRTVIFSIMVGNHAPRSNADRDAMDKVVAAIAAAN